MTDNLREIEEQHSQPPPCIFCDYEATIDVTPEGALTLERHYECPNCQRRFAILFRPSPQSRSDVH